jgi:hypothetical protein
LIWREEPAEEVVTSGAVGPKLVTELLDVADGLELPSADVVCVRLEMLEVGVVTVELGGVVDVPGLEPASDVEDSPEGFIGMEGLVEEVVVPEVMELKLTTGLPDAADGIEGMSPEMVGIRLKMLEAEVDVVEFVDADESPSVEPELDIDKVVGLIEAFGLDRIESVVPMLVLGKPVELVKGSGKLNEGVPEERVLIVVRGPTAEESEVRDVSGDCMGDCRLAVGETVAVEDGDVRLGRLVVLEFHGFHSSEAGQSGRPPKFGPRYTSRLGCSGIRGNAWRTWKFTNKTARESIDD